jgi:hypothetical protein
MPDEGLQLLRESECYSNHLNTIQGSAQFTIEEAASGEYLLQRFRIIMEKKIMIH